MRRLPAFKRPFLHRQRKRNQRFTIEEILNTAREKARPVSAAAPAAPRSPAGEFGFQLPSPGATTVKQHGIAPSAAGKNDENFLIFLLSSFVPGREGGTVCLGLQSERDHCVLHS
ncbi:MAG TPA: hypothetical protein PLT00_05025 [Verrucomicrobiota bacterium]|nr:hypothetical protein [Verrucomicrobiota bacterium]HQB16061.1 hypothetical protein [Verrucomicrobiota bacterium]